VPNVRNFSHASCLLLNKQNNCNVNINTDKFVPEQEDEALLSPNRIDIHHIHVECLAETWLQVIDFFFTLERILLSFNNLRNSLICCFT